MTLLRHLGAALAAAAALAVATTELSPFRDFQVAEVAVYVAAVAGLTVLVGLSGQISLGHGAFMAVGAYTSAICLGTLDWPLWAVLPACAVAAAAAGAAAGAAAARLRGPYLAGATLMLAVALPSLADRFPGVLGGDQGLSVTVAAPAALGGAFPLTRWQAWLCGAGALITLVALANLGRSAIGRSWRAIRDDEVAAALAGLNVARLRILAFVVSAACGGLAGALLAITTTLVSPGSFTVSLSIALLTGAVIGGLGSLAGAVWGSLLIVLVPTYITDVATSHGASTAVAANIPVAVYGLVLILVMLAFPEGVAGGLRRLAGPLAPAAGSLGARLRRRPDVPAQPPAPAEEPPNRPPPAGDPQEEVRP